MPLDISKLENVKERGGKIIAACPACREQGADTHRDNLAVFEGGGYRCIKDESAEHRRVIYQLAGSTSFSTSFIRPRPAPRRCARKPANLPRDLRAPSGVELAQIAAVRGWPTHDGLEELVSRRLLHFGTVSDRGHLAPSWILSDGITAEARRMDGAWYQGINAKPYSLSQKDRPVVSIPDTATTVYICEGLPDLLACSIALRLAGHDLAATGFLCVLGSGCKLGDAAQLLKDKHVVIAEDNDKEGKDAADKWTFEAYEGGAATVSSFVYVEGTKDFSDHLSTITAITLPAAEIAPDEPQPASATPAVTASGLDFTGFTKPPATYDGTPWNPAETTVVMFGEDRSVVEVHRKHAKACRQSLPSPPQRGPHNQR